MEKVLCTKKGWKYINEACIAGNLHETVQQSYQRGRKTRKPYDGRAQSCQHNARTI